MDADKIAQAKKHAGAKKPSMKRRDEHHDYTERRMYLITIEVADRRPLFGRVVGNPFDNADAPDTPHIELSPLGQAVQAEWLGIPCFYPQIEVKAIQMMPDHLHGILFVKTPLPVHLGKVIAGFKAGCRKRQREIETKLAIGAAKLPPTEKTEAGTQSQPAPGAPSPACFASPSPQATVLPSPVTSGSLPPLFAPGYNDLILRSYDELPVWQNYLRDNPRRLLLKRARPEWLHPFFGLRVGTTLYNGVGNRALLQAPKRIAVKVSRHLNAQEIAVVTRRYLTEAQQGAVLVSPAISPGEKQVMRTVFDAGFPTIVLLENGFTPLSKPHGEQFYACANGRLLMLCPWEHHNEKKPISRQQCQLLNYLTIELCSHPTDNNNGSPSAPINP
ncbi:MAG: transposase [Bacteroidales bacterium]|nr:transposase [Bacteroidales bacterium]